LAKCSSKGENVCCRRHEKNRKLSYRKDDRAMRPIYMGAFDRQTDGRHAISIPRYALVHRAVKRKA